MVATNTTVDLSLMSPKGKHQVSTLANLQYTQMQLGPLTFGACSMMSGEEDQQEEEVLGNNLYVHLEIHGVNIYAIWQ